MPLIFLILFGSFSVNAETFWITTELLKVDWREGCLTTANCAHPRFKIQEELLTLSDERTVSWPISEHFVQDAPRVLVSEWRSGKPEDVSVSCQVVGTDTMYGFPRTCDKTSSVRVFQATDSETPIHTRSRRHNMETTDEKGKSIIEIRGKCFNATLTIEKHTERCPTCPDPNDMTIIGQELPDELSVFSASILAPLRGEDRLMHIGMLALAAIAVCTSAAFGCLLVAFMRQKNFSRSTRQISVKPRYHLPYSPALVKTDDESRYDMPWELHRNLGYWQTKSDTATTTSPLDSSSSIGTGRYNYRSTMPPPQTRIYHHISPNSSIGAHDSGLESV
ncbi:unnamed protein product [Auanema sp. JU1783]|nr:unnamed protein product [Auanema sp. JU1783]